MNPRNEMLKALEAAMDCIAEGNAAAAMLPLWACHRSLRTDGLIIEVKSEPVLAPEDAVDRFNKDLALQRAQRKLERDRARKKREREMVRLAKQGKLPPMRQIKEPFIASINVACPKCHAPAGSPCTGFTSAGAFGKPTGIPIKTFHTARTQRAKARTQAQREAIPQRAFEGVTNAPEATEVVG